MDVTSNSITRQVSVRLDQPEQFDAAEGTTTVRVSSLKATLTTYPDQPESEPYVYVTGRGLQVLASGSVGSRERVVYSISYDDVPQPIRAGIAAALGLGLVAT